MKIREGANKAENGKRVSVQYTNHQATSLGKINAAGGERHEFRYDRTLPFLIYGVQIYRGKNRASLPDSITTCSILRSGCLYHPSKSALWAKSVPIMMVSRRCLTTFQGIGMGRYERGMPGRLLILVSWHTKVCRVGPGTQWSVRFCYPWSSSVPYTLAESKVPAAATGHACCTS